MLKVRKKNIERKRWRNGSRRRSVELAKSLLDENTNTFSRGGFLVDGPNVV